MNNNMKKKIMFDILCIIVGVAFIVGNIAGVVVDSFWSGMGGGLIGVGVVKLIRIFKYRSDDEYREQVEIDINDERNKYIANQAWALTGFVFMVIAFIAMIIFRIIGQESLSIGIGFSVCALLIIYSISYFYLQKKY